MTTQNILRHKRNYSSFKIRLSLTATGTEFHSRPDTRSSKCSFQLFESLVQPILSYGSEIWAPYLLRNLNVNNFISLCDKNPGELLHVKLCKLILGVHRKATNHAVRGDLGSFLILIPMLCHSIKYWWHLNDLCYKNINTLVVDALLDNRKLCVNYHATWSSYIQNILKIIGKQDIWEKPNTCSKANISNTIQSGLHNLYVTLWSNAINTTQPKLRTYCRFKMEFIIENYVKLYKRSARVNFTKLRISTHPLMVEKGRHLSPKLPLSERLCKYCSLQEIEDEFHFVMKCTLYNSQRDKLFKELTETYEFTSLSNDDIFLQIMRTTDYDILTLIFSFVNSCFDTRNNADSPDSTSVVTVE